MLMWITTSTLILIAIFYYKLVKIYKYWEKKNVLQIKPWPLVGNFAPLMFRKTSLSETAEYLYNYFPNARYFGIYQFMLPTLVLRDLDLIKRITVKEFEKFPEHRTVVLEDGDPLFAKNLFFMKGGDRWHDLRSTLSPSFTSCKMRIMFTLMNQCAAQFMKHFENQTGTITVEMKDVFTRYTNDVIGTTAFGITCNSLENPENEFYLMGKKAVTISPLIGLKLFMYAISPTIMKLLKFRILPAKVDMFIRTVISETIKVREEKGIVRPDMLHLLIEAKNGRLKYDDSDEIDSGFAVVHESKTSKTHKQRKAEITDEDIAAQAFIFFAAGFDTASTLMCFTAYELAINPDVQEKLRREVDGILEGNNGAPITYDELLTMKYLDMVITETLRKWPPIIFTDRKSIKPFTIEAKTPEESDVSFDAGTVCWIPIYPIHRDPNYYPDPDKFDPERFNNENKQFIKPFTYLPFGLGPKNCIGSRFALLETKLIIYNIISKYEIVVVDKTVIPMVTSKKGFFLAAEGGIWLGLKLRRE